MSIGETLAAARQRTGLSVAQVSERTRIRETLIAGIENGDFSGSGGDFYARGHIRAIATVVGADPGPLIAEYDRRFRARDVAAVVSLEELLAASAQRTDRDKARRATLPRLAAVTVLMLAAGFGVYQTLSHQAAAPPHRVARASGLGYAAAPQVPPHAAPARASVPHARHPARWDPGRTLAGRRASRSRATLQPLSRQPPARVHGRHSHWRGRHGRHVRHGWARQHGHPHQRSGRARVIPR